MLDIFFFFFMINFRFHLFLNCSISHLVDINKFLWMVRIGGSTDTGRHIKEHDYYTHTGEFRVDREGSPVLLNCLMYKMCYYRFGQVYTEASECLCPGCSTGLGLHFFFFFRELTRALCRTSSRLRSRP